MLAREILEKTATIGIVGLGYVGLPLAIDFGRAGFKTIGIDIDEKRVESINRHSSYIIDVTDDDLKTFQLQATADFGNLRSVDVSIICVPTPLRETREPDLSCVISASKQIAANLHPGQMVVLESTSYSGTARDIVLPILETSGLRVGTDFYLVVSPERIDPGNKRYTVKNIPKLVSGVTDDCTFLGKLLYRQLCDEVIPVSSLEVAEMAKTFENAFRNVNIALVNELAMLCDRMNIDTKEVIDAAATKPFGFMPFYPGPGIGGHCIPVDPLYLTWIARKFNRPMRLIELSDEINNFMPNYAVSRIEETISRQGKSANNAAILILGITYKKDINDLRESPALKILELLLGNKAKVCYNDPYCDKVRIGEESLNSVELTEALLNQSDCVAIVTDHSCYDYEWIARNSNTLVDLRNVYPKASRLPRGNSSIMKNPPH